MTIMSSTGDGDGDAEGTGDASSQPPREHGELGLHVDPRTLDEDFPCGDGFNGFTICGPEVWPGGEALVLAGATEEDIPLDQTEWHVARYAPGGGWQLATSTAVDSNIQPFSSAARVVFKGNAVMWIVPSSEFGAACPDWRVTSFAHKGDYGLNPPNEWSGRLEPPVDMGLNSCN